MANLRALALSTVALVALSSAASAADLLPPPPALEPMAPIAAPEMGGWYIRGDVGVGVTNSMSGVSEPNPLTVSGPGYSEGWFNSSVSEAALFGVGVGYQVNNWFRADVTGELRGGSHFSGLEVATAPGPLANTQSQWADFYRGNLNTTLAMVNLYADLGTWHTATPFVGAGVGLAFNQLYGGTDTGANSLWGANALGAVTSFTSSSGGVLPSGTQMSLAWSLMAGVGFDVTRNLKLELSYRYLDYGKFKSGASQCLSGTAPGTVGSTFCGNNGSGYKIASTRLSSNDFRVGLRYYFDNPSPAPAPEMPLVRKY
jgi:opacity protein-like surface antigen